MLHKGSRKLMTSSWEIPFARPEVVYHRGRCHAQPARTDQNFRLSSSLQKRLQQRSLPHRWNLLSCGTPDKCSQQFEPEFSKQVDSARPTHVSGYNCRTRTTSCRKRLDCSLAPFAPSAVSQATALSLTQPTFEARKQSGRPNQKSLMAVPATFSLEKLSLRYTSQAPVSAAQIFHALFLFIPNTTDYQCWQPSQGARQSFILGGKHFCDVYAGHVRKVGLDDWSFSFPPEIT